MTANTLSALLKSARSAQNLSIRTVAQRAHIDPATLSRWEKGTNQPRLVELEAVLKALDLSAKERTQAITLLAAPRAVTRIRQEAAQVSPEFASLFGVSPCDGDILRAMRLRAGKTLAETARTVGVQASTLSRWERSETWPDHEKLHTLCYALGAHEAEVALLTCRRGSLFTYSQKDSASSILREGKAIFEGEWKQPAELLDLVTLGLEARAWKLLPDTKTAQAVLFTLYYWRMQTLFNEERYTSASDYITRVLELTEFLPAKIVLPIDEASPVVIPMQEARSRAWIYRANIADRRAPGTRRRVGLRLARCWEDAPDVYHRAWMMSVAAELLVKTGERETALDWGLRACKLVSTTDNHIETQFRLRDYAKILTWAGEGGAGLSALEDSSPLNDLFADSRARYHLLHTEFQLAQSRAALACDSLEQARNVIAMQGLTYLSPRLEELAERL